MKCVQGVDIIVVIAIMNVVLTGLHYALFEIYKRYRWTWSNRALSVVDFLMTVVAWVSANKRHPDDMPEVTPPLKKEK